MVAVAGVVQVGVAQMMSLTLAGMVVGVESSKPPAKAVSSERYEIKLEGRQEVAEEEEEE